MTIGVDDRSPGTANGYHGQNIGRSGLVVNDHSPVDVEPAGVEYPWPSTGSVGPYAARSRTRRIVPIRLRRGGGQRAVPTYSRQHTARIQHRLIQTHHTVDFSRSSSRSWSTRTWNAARRRERHH